jgi:hypothetical protein
MWDFWFQAAVVLDILYSLPAAGATKFFSSGLEGLRLTSLAISRIVMKLGGKLHLLPALFEADTQVQPALGLKLGQPDGQSLIACEREVLRFADWLPYDVRFTVSS